MKVPDRRDPTSHTEVNWVEERLTPIEAHIDDLLSQVAVLQEDVQEIKDSMPNKSVPDHRMMHAAYLALGIELEKKDEESKRLKTEIKNDFIKTAAKAAVAVIAGILLLGIQSQFSNMVHKVVDVPAATVVGGTK